MNEVARRYWNEALDLHAPVTDEPRRVSRRAKLVKVLRVRAVRRDARR